MKSWYYVIGAALVAYAVSVSLLVVRYEGTPGPPARKAAAGADERAAETNESERGPSTSAEANGPEAWFIRTELHTPWCPPNPKIKLVSAAELLVPCTGGKRAENVVAFDADRDRWVTGPRLVLASIDGKRWAYLGVEGVYPQFSPDGTKIVYDGREGLCVINADGSGKKLLSGYYGITGFTFTPDSRAVVYTARIEKKTGAEIFYGMFLADVAGRDRRLIYSSDEYLASPSLPASGEEIAFERGPDIYVINVDGSGLRRVTGPSEENEYVEDIAPNFSPDGSKISFLSGGDEDDDHAMTLDAYVVNVDGTGRRNLTADDKRDERPFFSRDGERIVFQSWKGGITVADVNTFELRRIPTTYGGGGHHDFLFPSFSPDDRKIVYDPAAGMATRQIYVINADGTGDTWLSPGGKVCYEHPCFSPMRVDGVLLDTYGRVIEE